QNPKPLPHDIPLRHAPRLCQAHRHRASCLRRPLQPRRQQRRLHPAPPEIRQRARPKQPRHRPSQSQRRPTRHAPIHPRQVALRILSQREHLHHAQQLRRHGKMLREPLRHRQRPQIHLPRRRLPHLHPIRRSPPLIPRNPPHHHIREFADVIPPLLVVFQQRGVRQRTRLHPHRLFPRKIKLFQPVKIRFTHRPVQSQPYRLRHRRIRPAIHRIPPRNRFHRAIGFRLQRLPHLRASHCCFAFRQLNLPRQRQIQQRDVHPSSVPHSFLSFSSSNHQLFPPLILPFPFYLLPSVSLRLPP